jgi:hypothetical protein
MIYEIELYVNSMSDKTEKITVEGTGFMTTDTIDGALFSVIGARGAVSLTVPYPRLKSMRVVRKTQGEAIGLAGRHKEKAIIS